MSSEMQTKVQANPAQNFMPVQTGLLQKKSALCNTPGLVEDSGRDQEKLTLQRSSVDQAGTATVPPIVHEVLSSPGQPLDLATRSNFESRFGYDFSAVQVHHDPMAQESARRLHAKAYTVGQNIVFSKGHYSPDSRQGRELIAEELAHTIQQGRGGDVPKLDPSDAHEQDAKIAAKAAVNGSVPVTVRSATGVGIARSIDDWLVSTPDIQTWSFNQLQDEIDEIQQWLRKQTSSTPESIHLEKVLLTLQKEVKSRKNMAVGKRREIMDKKYAIPSIPSATTLSGIPSEKWSLDVESAYRRAGFIKAANAVQGCREWGICTNLLTDVEVDNAYRSGRLITGLGELKPETYQEQMAMAGAGAAPAAVPWATGAETAAAKTALERAAERWAASTAGAAPATNVSTIAIPIAIPIAVGLYLKFMVEDLSSLASFQKALYKQGYVILPNPLGVCIGLCHRSAAQPFPPLPELPPILKPMPDPEEEELFCQVEQVAPKFGRYPCHSDFAKTFSGTRREFQVTAPEGISKSFDAKWGNMLYEVKTGYGWMLNPNLSPHMQRRKEKVIDHFSSQSQMQLLVSTRCGYELNWYFNSESVAKYFQSLVEPPVEFKEFDCDKDSDHTW